LKALQWTAQYSKQFDNFSDDVISGIRKNDEMIKYINDMFSEIQRHIPQNLKYLGYRYDDTGNRFRELNVGKEKKRKVRKADEVKTMSIYDTYARLAIFQFQVSIKNQQTGELETRYAECPLYIPLYVDNYHFFIRGNRYSAPFQITDSITYTNRANMVVLKTMTRAIKLAREKKNSPILDAHGNKYVSQLFYVYISSKKVPFLLYYFAHFGFVETFKYFGVDQWCAFFDDAPPLPDESFIFFKFGLIYIRVDRHAFESNYLFRQFISTALELQKRYMDSDSITNTTRWKMILGATISEANALTKGEALLKTFRISLDHQTIQNIANLIGGSPKITTHAVVRWMFIKFSNLSSKTNSLLNKRIRLSEWLIDPLLKEVYKKLYRFMGTPEKNKDMDRLMDIIKTPSGLIVGAICGKNRRSLSLNIAKYSSGVNDNALLNVALKATFGGPGTPTEKSGSMTSVVYRQFDPSFMSRLCVTTSSNSEPGLSSNLCPMTLIDMDTLTFSSNKKL
jgi:hypothetical protein